MQYKTTKKIIIDQRKLETLFRLGCPDNRIIQMLKTGQFTPTNDPLIDDTLESLLDHKAFNNKNWGGVRKGAGAPKGNTNAKKNNQNNQDNNQDTDKDKDKDNNNSRIDIDNIYTTRAHAREIIKQTATNMNIKHRSNNFVQITPEFIFPADQFFDAYRRQLPDATARAEQWLRKSNMVGKAITAKKLGEIIQKFDKNQKNT